MNWKLIGIAALLFGVYLLYMQAGRPSYYRALKTLQEQVLTPDHVANNDQLGIDIAKGRKGRSKIGLTMTDVENDRKAVLPSAERAANIDMIGKEWEATARGELLKPRGVWLPGSQASWMPTPIPIYSCMHLSVAGQISYGTYTAGPDGVDLESYTPQNRESFLSMNKDRTTLVPGVRWGAVLGQACQDPQGQECAAPFPIGQGIYVSPKQIGAGHLAVISNGFVYGQTGVGLLSGTKQMNMSDYNAYEGGFRIDWEKAEDYMCSQPAALVARR